MRGAVTTIRFGETPPISTYLFAFAAGRFQAETAERSGRRFTMLHRETDAAKVARNREAIFDLHAAAIEWLERYTGIPYPFGKFDFVLIPSFQFGGMEHPGSIFYNASSLLLDPSATTNQKLGRASLIAHETAHMWFGDLVTMRWFDDVWMKEVFANFMAAKIVNPSFPEINHELRFLYAHYPAAYDVDRTAGTNAIRQRLDNLNEAGIALRRDHLPEGADRDASARDDRDARRAARWSARLPEAARVRQRLVARSHRAARSTDAGGSRRLEPRVGGRGGPADDRNRARPRVAACPSASRIRCPERGLRWAQRLKVALGNGGATEMQDVALRAEPATAVGGTEKRRRRGTDYILPTGGGIGYGDFVLDSRTAQLSDRALADIPDPLTRGAALVTLWEEMLDGRVAPHALFDDAHGRASARAGRALRPAHARLHAAAVLEVPERRRTAA